ncbi:MAG: membrane protein insertion efficiency factor YidD [Actinobacteria bacterium]|nr:membrane protein insertion efficiency factor YidD [Actinomycetota bacterium]
MSREPRSRDRGVGRLLWWAGWPLRTLLLLVFRGYQRFISPMTPPSCRYHPSCSSYGVQAVQQHGATKGTLLTVARLVRCNPWSGGGVNPVPERGHWRPDVRPDGSPRYRENRDTAALDGEIGDPLGTAHQSLGSGA